MKLSPFPAKCVSQWWPCFRFIKSRFIQMNGWPLGNETNDTFFMVRDWGLKLPSFTSHVPAIFWGLTLIHSSSPFARSIESHQKISKCWIWRTTQPATTTTTTTASMTTTVMTTSIGSGACIHNTDCETSDWCTQKEAGDCCAGFFIFLLGFVFLVIFCGFYHGFITIFHHHLGEYFDELFSVIEQAYPSFRCFLYFFVTLNHGIFTTKNRFLVRER